MSRPAQPAEKAAQAVRRAIAKNAFCVLCTSSAANRPHAVGVLYAAVDGVLYVATLESSKKVRNIRENPRAAVCIPVRRYPVAPPFAVQFGALAEVLPPRDDRIAGLVETRQLKKITSHGELDDPRTCFLRLTPDAKVSSYGVGVPLRTLLRDPLHASRTFDLGAR